MEKQIKNIIIGAGISGLSAGYHLDKNNEDYVIFEKSNSYGGLCGSFEIGGFYFDKFIHLCFTKNEYVKNVFNKSTNEIEHIPNPYNYYKGLFIKHPAQNNLYPLSIEEKNKILNDFKNRKNISLNLIDNYEEWLKVQYGDYFAKEFPIKYTKKYWKTNPQNMDINWIGDRMYKPTYDEVYQGTISDKTPITYYAPKMYYPEKGKYISYLKNIIEKIKNKIYLNKEIIEINLEKKYVKDKEQNIYNYENLYSSIPLDKLPKITKDIPKNILKSSDKLKYTSGYMVSLGINKPEISPYLWLYVYDEEFLSTRIYFPSKKSIENCPQNTSSLQVEIYYTKDNPISYSENEILDRVIEELIQMKLINKQDILIKDIRKEEYANIIFTKETEDNKKLIKKYFEDKNVALIGRFGEWEYFWSDQSFLSGKEKILK
ncbi:Protoporphyrinogen oxidase [Cetobacterium ceti]|uniref:Protoporphyrinogen oxidase n=1 Tax=Cetobacterium ceti TaxID=180163 RepID=A0A1T4LTG2_9FUSO|nr:NAD(P)-binding protein [Cetobacterium ceti]SJZ57993.1 Protoporphyrinogen oxidase [Cetobacterium ceti]